MRKIIKLNESDLHKIIAETVKSAINEIGDTDKGQYALGAASARRSKRADDALKNKDTDKYWDEFKQSERINKHARRKYEQPRNHENFPDSKEFNRGWDEYMAKNESRLHRIIDESVKMAINEIGDTDEGQYDLGRAAGRRYIRSLDATTQDAATQHGDYADRIAGHAAANCNSLEHGKNFDIGFEDVLNYYNKNKQK